MKAKQRKFCSKQSFLKSRLSSTCPSPQMWGRRKIARKGYFSSGSRAVQCNSSNLTLLSSGTRLYQVQCTCAAVLTCRAECSSMNYIYVKQTCRALFSVKHFSYFCFTSRLVAGACLACDIHVILHTFARSSTEKCVCKFCSNMCTALHCGSIDSVLCTSEHWAQYQCSGPPSSLWVIMGHHGSEPHAGFKTEFVSHRFACLRSA